MIKVIISIYIFILLSNSALSLNRIKTNFEVLDSLVAGYVEFIIKEFENYGSDKLAIILTKHSAEWLFRKHLLERQKNKLLIFSDDSSFNTSSLKLEIWINKLIVIFDVKDDDSEIIVREALIDVSTGLTNADGISLNLERYRNIYRDSISVNEIDKVQDGQYDFAKVKLPERERTLFEKIIEPAIVITAAAITTLLLFTVRTK